jgi:hypothetical protein
MICCFFLKISFDMLLALHGEMPCARVLANSDASRRSADGQQQPAAIDA